MTEHPTRRRALGCLGFGAASLFALSGGAPVLVDFAAAAEAGQGQTPTLGAPLFVQLSDSHIGFSKAANPDVAATFERAIARVNALPRAPGLVLHTGDISHLSRPAEFDAAAQMMKGLKVAEIHTVPGEHDVADGAGEAYFARFGGGARRGGGYSFDHAGVHFVGLNNVMRFKPGGLAALGDDQLAWLADDLAGRRASQPIVVFAHMPLWTIYEPWGWGTADAEPLAALLRRFASVTVLNGHIHQIVSKLEGNITFHTARSTAYPQPAAGVGPGPGPLNVGPDHLLAALGITAVSRAPHRGALALADATLA